MLGGALLSIAYLQPWYALWLLPFLAVVAAPAWLWFSGTLPLIYVAIGLVLAAVRISGRDAPASRATSPAEATPA